MGRVFARKTMAVWNFIGGGFYLGITKRILLRIIRHKIKNITLVGFRLCVVPVLPGSYRYVR